jgi:hypothetical protein
MSVMMDDLPSTACISRDPKDDQSIRNTIHSISIATVTGILNYTLNLESITQAVTQKKARFLFHLIIFN